MKRIKTFLKKYYFPILTEAVVLCIIVVLSRQILISEKIKVNDSIDPGRYLETFSEYEGNNLINDFFISTMTSLGYWGGGPLGTERNSCYGLSIQLFDSKGNLIAETPPRFLAVEWRVWIDETHASDSSLIFLEHYFSNKELDELIKVTNQWENIRILSMTGYYENEEKFIPVELVLANTEKGSAEEYILTAKNADIEGKPLEIRYNALWTTELPLSQEGQTLVGCDFSTYFLNTNPDVQEKLQKELKLKLSYNIPFQSWEEDLDYLFFSYYGTTTKQNNITYNIVTCVDTTALAWYAALHSTYMVPMWILCQGLGIILIAAYIYLQKKQQKLDEMRNTFLNAIAHEMKTPAAVIKNSSECIREGIQPEKQKHYLEMIEKEADHMNKLLNSMLVYTRTSEEQYQLKLESHDIGTLALKAFEPYKEIAQQKGIDVQWNLTASSLFRCDKDLMTMVLDNFFSNAVKYCPEHRTIKVSVQSGKFQIYNDGEAFSEEHKKQIWEPLFKIDTARSEEKNSSSGMGLAIAASILKLHQFVYGVQNKDSGVEFYFRT